MKKRLFLLRNFMLLSLLLLVGGCASELDFDQVEQFELEPVYVGNLTYFDIKAADYPTSSIAKIILDQQDFSPFQQAFMRENLIKSELYFEVENTIQRSFLIQFEMLNASGGVIYTIPISIGASTGGVVNVTHTDIFEGAKLSALKQMTQVRFVLLMQSGVPITSTSTGNLKLRSGATLYFNVQ